MSYLMKVFHVWLAILVVVMGVSVLADAVLAANHAGKQRPIEDFVLAQGTFCFDDGAGGCFLFVPPLENFLGAGDPATGRLASVDYAGIAARWLEANGGPSLGTLFAGSISERRLADGRAQVHIVLHVKNALTWVVEGNDFATSPLVFGYRAPDVLAGASPVLCDAHYQLTLINTALGAPLPDLIQLLVAPEAGQEFKTLSLRCNASGTLRPASGYEEGTPGKVIIVQTNVPAQPGKGAVADGFPVERIDLHATGSAKPSASSSDAGIIPGSPKLFLPLMTAQ